MTTNIKRFEQRISKDYDKVFKKIMDNYNLPSNEQIKAKSKLIISILEKKSFIRYESSKKLDSNKFNINNNIDQLLQLYTELKDEAFIGKKLAAQYEVKEIQKLAKLEDVNDVFNTVLSLIYSISKLIQSYIDICVIESADNSKLAMSIKDSLRDIDFNSRLPKSCNVVLRLDQDLYNKYFCFSNNRHNPINRRALCLALEENISFYVYDYDEEKIARLNKVSEQINKITKHLNTERLKGKFSGFASVYNDLNAIANYIIKLTKQEKK